MKIWYAMMEERNSYNWENPAYDIQTAINMMKEYNDWLERLGYPRTAYILVMDDGCDENGNFVRKPAKLAEITEGQHMPATIADMLKDWERTVSYMDDDIREAVHAELAPCMNAEFLGRYMDLHREKFGEEFVIN